MGTELLKTVGQIAGIGGIALGVFLLLYRDIIRKKIFPSLTKQQGFQLLMLISVLVWSIALAGIGAWVWTTKTAGGGNTTIDQKGADIDQLVADGGIAVAHTGKGDVRIHITLEEYEARLKTREKEVTERLEKAHAQQRKLYEIELGSVRKRLQDSKLSYLENIKDLSKRIVQLESIRGQVPDEVLAQAQTALARGDAEQANALSKRIEDQAADTIIEYGNEIDKKIRNLKKANIVFNSPTSMLKDKVESVALILSANEDVEKLLQELSGEEKESSVVKFSKRMKAELIGENKKAFEIVKITPTVQPVSSLIRTRWQWDVTPLESGVQYLHLTLTALITIDEKETELSIKTFDKEIQVNVLVVDEIKHFITEKWEWILGSLIFPLIVWYWKSKHSKKVDNNG